MSESHLHSDRTRHKKGRKPRISMNYLIHNEADIIEANIRYHASVGISSFVVMDNGSSDGSYEIVQALAREFAIELVRRPELDYRQSEWKTEMARISSKVHGAGWSIANDADEFWLPKGSSLASLLPRFGASCYCRRYNMLPAYEDFCADRPWYRTQYVVKHPVPLTSEDILHRDNVSVMLHRIHGKVIVNNTGLVRVHGGNHRASHLFNPLWKKDLREVVVLHYPLRGKSLWLKTLQRRQTLLAERNPKMGNHYRRWVRMLQQGTLDEEISRLALKYKQLRLLMDIGVVAAFPGLYPEFTSAYQYLFDRFTDHYQS